MLTVKQEGTDFPIAQFTDFYDHPCSVEQSSIFFPKCIWLGRDGYQMHLSVEQVKELLPVLERFVEYGDIIERHG
jgi:hypothetical protein